MVDRSRKPLYESMKDRIPNTNMAISEAETSTVIVLLKESDIPEAGLTERKPANLEKANISLAENGMGGKLNESILFLIGNLRHPLPVNDEIKK